MLASPASDATPLLAAAASGTVLSDSFGPSLPDLPGPSRSGTPVLAATPSLCSTPPCAEPTPDPAPCLKAPEATGAPAPPHDRELPSLVHHAAVAALASSCSRQLALRCFERWERHAHRQHMPTESTPLQLRSVIARQQEALGEKDRIISYMAQSRDLAVAASDGKLADELLELRAKVQSVEAELTAVKAAAAAAHAATMAAAAKVPRNRDVTARVPRPARPPEARRPGNGDIRREHAVSAPDVDILDDEAGPSTAGIPSRRPSVADVGTPLRGATPPGPPPDVVRGVDPRDVRPVMDGSLLRTTNPLRSVVRIPAPTLTANGIAVSKDLSPRNEAPDAPKTAPDPRNVRAGSVKPADTMQLPLPVGGKPPGPANHGLRGSKTRSSSVRASVTRPPPQRATPTRSQFASRPTL